MKRTKRKDYPIECIFDLSPDNIVIPPDWTPEQADRITSIVELVEEKIWDTYADIIIARHRENCLIDEHEALCAKFESEHGLADDDMPF